MADDQLGQFPVPQNSSGQPTNKSQSSQNSVDDQSPTLSNAPKQEPSTPIDTTSNNTTSQSDNPKHEDTEDTKPDVSTLISELKEDPLLNPEPEPQEETPETTSDPDYFEETPEEIPAKAVPIVVPESQTSSDTNQQQKSEQPLILSVDETPNNETNHDEFDFTENDEIASDQQSNELPVESTNPSSTIPEAQSNETLDSNTEETPNTPPESSPEPTEQKTEPISEPVKSEEANKPVDAPATIPDSISKSKFNPLIVTIIGFLLLIGVTGIVFFIVQSMNLKKQVGDLTQTIKKQETVTTPTPTKGDSEEVPLPSTYITPTVSISPIATPTGSIFPSELTPTPTKDLKAELSILNAPLSIADEVLKTALNYKPAAQLILIKVENAQDPDKYLVSFFFRYSLTDKSYFKITTSNGIESETVDNHITVTPDNSIPSINESILKGKLGMDLTDAYKLIYELCTDKKVCGESQLKAQYIITPQGFPLWQINLVSAQKDIKVQINASTKEVVFKSANI